MGEEAEKLSGKLGLDTTDFKTAAAAANREIRILESSFRASAAALTDWTKDATGLESRVKTLTSQIDIQQSKVAALAEEHRRLVAEHGENSRAAQDAEIKLNKETETLNKMKTELGDTESSLADMTGGEEEAGEAAETLGDQVEESGSKVETFKSVLSGIGSVTKTVITGILAVGTAAITAVAALGGLGINAATTAEQFADLSTKTGMSAESLQEWNYASDILGSSLDTITGAQSRLVRSMSAAQEQTGLFSEKLSEANANSWDNLEAGDVVLGDMAKAFQTLGVSVTDSNGNLRDSEAVFSDALEALGGVGNEAERDALAMQIFGKSAQELNPLIKAGSGEIAKLKQEAHEMGAVMSEEDVAAASAFKDQLDGLKLGFQGIVAQIGLAFIPGLSGIATQAKGYLTDIVGVVQGSGGDVGKITQGLGEILGRIVTDLAAQAPQLLQVGLGLIQSILKAITTALPTLLPAAVQILTALINFIVTALPMLISAGVPLLLTLVQAIIQNLPMLIEAALQAIIALANGLTAALPTLIPAVVEAIIMIVQTLIDNLPLLVDAALQLIMALAQGLIVALPILIQAMPQLVSALIDALMQALPMIATVAGQLLGALAMALIANLPVLLDAGANVVAKLLDTLMSKRLSLVDIGKFFIQGLGEGIKNTAGWLYDVIRQVGENLLTTIKTALGIASPSKPMKAIGKNLMLSPILGAQEEMLRVERFFSSAFRRLPLAAASATAGGSQTVTTNDNSFDIWGNVIIQGDTPSGSLGATLKGKRF